MQKKDKLKVLDEVWTEERVRGFLDIASPVGIDGDFHVLQKAYQQMKAENFAQFISFFSEAGRNINAVGPEGKTLLAIVSQHRRSGEYASLLQEAGAQ